MKCNNYQGASSIENVLNQLLKAMLKPNTYFATINESTADNSIN